MGKRLPKCLAVGSKIGQKWHYLDHLLTPMGRAAVARIPPVDHAEVEATAALWRTRYLALPSAGPLFDMPASATPTGRAAIAPIPDGPTAGPLFDAEVPSSVSPDAPSPLAGPPSAGPLFDVARDAGEQAGPPSATPPV